MKSNKCYNLILKEKNMKRLKFINYRLIKIYIQLFINIKLLFKTTFLVTYLLLNFIFISCNSTKVFETNNITYVSNLVKKGGDVNTPISGYTRLYLAVQQKDTVLIKYLLENGADVNKKSRSGWQPLHVAIVLNSPEIVKILIDNNADTISKNPLGETPIQMAESKGFVEIIKILKNESLDTLTDPSLDLKPKEDLVQIKSTKIQFQQNLR